MTVTRESAKKVITYDHQGNENGFLVELYKDGEKTTTYLTVAKPGAFKGYHLHRIRAARYVCIKGRMKIITYTLIEGAWKRDEFVLGADTPERTYIPAGVATGLENIGEDEAWLVNHPDPAYDPALKDEQVEYTQEELEKGIVK
jgi:dTDP-4-dehydrorhamnose 3,5-epimerase-like enzyme